MSGHTKGPWTAAQDKTPFQAHLPSDERPWVVLIGTMSRGMRVCEIGKEADARLIAAAPALLKACKAQRRVISALVEIIEDARRTVAVDGKGVWAQELIARIDSGGANLPESDAIGAIAKAIGGGGT